MVTSPPYWGLRDYGLNGRGIGLEASPDEYVAQMVGVFREVWRVLRKDGTVWLNLGDSYASDGGFRKYGSWDHAIGRRYNSGRRPSGNGLKPKDLGGMPWRVALALQADGWWLRSDIIWHKPNPMPESVRDRPTRAHEYVFLLAKRKRYYYDAEAVREAAVYEGDCRHLRGDVSKGEGGPREDGGSRARTGTATSGHNKRSVWTITPQPYKGAHFATFPVKLVEPMVLAGTSAKGCCPECGKPWERMVEKGLTVHDGETESEYPQGSTANRLARLRQAARARGEEYVNTTRTIGWHPGCDCSEVVARDGDLEVEPFEPIPCTVLDPFGGTMTVGEVCAKHGRRFVGLDLKQEYVAMGRERCADTQMVMVL